MIFTFFFNQRHSKRYVIHSSHLNDLPRTNIFETVFNEYVLWSSKMSYIVRNADFEMCDSIWENPSDFEKNSKLRHKLAPSRTLWIPKILI